MSIVDTIVIIVYLIIVLFTGYFVGKDNKDQEDYFLAGRAMNWFPVALSVAATMISANGFIGGPGWAYLDGMSPFMINVAVPFAIFFSMFITTPIIYKLKVTSVYQYMNYRFGNICRNLTVLQFFINSLIQVSSMVFIPSIIVEKITGWSLTIVVPIIVVIALIYTLVGGLKAVIWTDAIQMFVVWGNVIFVIYTALKKADMSLLDSIVYAKEAGKLNTLDFSFDITKPNTFWATLIGGSIFWIRYFAFDQIQIQRILSAKSIKNLKASLFTSALVSNITYFFMLFVGIILFAFFNGRIFKASNDVMIEFILENIPVGVVGLVIAGVFAASMSSVDSILNSMTTVFIKDIYEEYFSKDKKEATLSFLMIVSAVLGIIIIIFVLVGFKGSVKSVLDVVGGYISYFSGPACGVFLLAIFTKKANDKGSALGFIFGFIIGLYLAKTYNIFWIINPAIGAFITFVTGYIFSCIIPTKTNKSDIEKYTIFGISKLQNESAEDIKYGIPLKFDKYSVSVLVFFFIQYIILFILQYC